MAALSPADRARAKAALNLKLIELQKRRNKATDTIADALVDIATIDTAADALLDDLEDLRRPNAGSLSGS